MPDKNRKANSLINSSSPYLLQHAYNPVDWKPWDEKILEHNRSEGKLLLISIGYSACHWCHVMEEHCFEDEEVAAFMNKHFVNIKVDREERPDIDHIYMDALQLMSGQGGWPLNIVALPNQRPFWGATYLPKDRWLSALSQLVELHKSDPGKVESYAANLHQGLRETKLVASDEKPVRESGRIDRAIREWSSLWDEVYGGNNRAPKFMMPATLDMLMQYGWKRKDQAVLDHVRTTLMRMAWGGVHDVVGGGFARYSVDARWHVPHFEKMLYDNGLLLRTYSDAYTQFGDELFRETAEGIANFIRRELLSEHGGLYSALDADSLNTSGESEEGAFYVWTDKEIDEVLTHKEARLIKVCFNMNDKGHWENGNYVFIRDRSWERLARDLEMNETEMRESLNKSLLLLRNYREANRKPPERDSKIIASWNAITGSGLLRAFRVFGDESYRDIADGILEFIEQELVAEQRGFLRRTFGQDGREREGFLDDYAFLIRFYTDRYQILQQNRDLEQALYWTDYVLQTFGRPDTALLAYASQKQGSLIRNTFETEDNVIPSSNAVMCENLWVLGRLFPSLEYTAISERMRDEIWETAVRYPGYYALWLKVFLFEEGPFYEVAVLGEDNSQGLKELFKTYHPHRIYAGSGRPTDFPEVLNGKQVGDDIRYFACQYGHCQLPVHSIQELEKTTKP